MGYSFWHDDLFPIIDQMVEKLCVRTNEFVTHDKISENLFVESSAQKYINYAYQARQARRPETRENIVSNMVAWFSQNMSTSRSNYYDYLNQKYQRKRIRRKWAYQLK